MGHKIWISAGGTGGHLFPALALAAELRASEPTAELVFIGGGLAANRYFDREQYRFEDVACGSIVRKHPAVLLRSLSRMASGVWQSHRLLRRERPDLIVGFGSFYSFPPLVAAKLAGVPMMLHASDALPGKVIRLLSRYAALTALQFGEAAQHLRGPSVVAQMPLRPGLKKGAVTREQACAAFGLRSDKRVLLVFGGSQGARRINQLVGEALDNIDKELQVLHCTGDAAIAEELQQRYQKSGRTACVKPFESRMDLAWSAADFAITRSGASTIAEMNEYEVPAILIPYPYATDNHQELNADVMAKQIGGAIKLVEACLTAEQLGRAVSAMLANGAERLESMRAAIQKSKSDTPRPTLGEVVLETVRKRKT